MEAHLERLRPPAVAGSFYPAEPDRLQALVRQYLARVPGGGRPPKAVIVPHAGFAYSGPVAAFAYARLALARAWVRRVVLLGPCHRVAFRGLAVSAASGFATPLGVVDNDPDGVWAALSLPAVRRDEAPHQREHSLEVQLPFLQTVLGSFKLVPVVVGDAEPEEVDALLEHLWGGEETAVVVSSDLSHYLEAGAARVRDAATAAAIRDLEPQRLDPDAACGAIPVRGLLLTARRRGLACEILDVRSSGDTAGDRDRVVGYGAFAFA
jgi:hypothetical protein